MAHDFVSQVSGERAVARGWELAGDEPERVRVARAGDPMNDLLKSGLEMHGMGIYQFG
jgi:hypothetical protein